MHQLFFIFSNFCSFLFSTYNVRFHESILDFTNKIEYHINW